MVSVAALLFLSYRLTHSWTFIEVHDYVLYSEIDLIMSYHRKRMDGLRLIAI